MGTLARKQDRKVILVRGLGSTIFSYVALDLLQRNFNKLGDGYSASYQDYKTQETVSNVINQLRSQKWSFEGMSEAHLQISYARHETIVTIVGKATNMRNDCSIAVLLDFPSVFKKDEDTFFLSYEFKDIRSLVMSQLVYKIAFIFTKSDFYNITAEEMEKKFKTQYPNICTWLNEWDLEYKFFTAYAVKTVKVGNTRIPIEGYSPLEHSEGVDTAMYWLLNIEKP